MIYLIHRFGGDMHNLENAEQWMVWLNRRYRETFIAPWTTFGRVIPYGTKDEAWVLAKCFKLIEECSGVLAINIKGSSGARMELECAAKHQKTICSLPHLTVVEVLTGLELALLDNHFGNPRT